MIKLRMMDAVGKARGAAVHLGLATLGLAAFGLAATAGSALAATDGDEARCAALTQLQGSAFPDSTTQVEQAELRGPTPAEGPLPMPVALMRPPNGAAPAHCEVFGRLDPRKGANGQAYAIRFHMRLPTQWNGDLFFQGGGGTDGEVGSALGPLLGAQADNALSRGYAVVSDDAGHDNRTNNDPKLQGTATFGWDAQARRNYGFASIGAVTPLAKTIVRAYYGRFPKLTYFVGGSKGGQEALMAAERYPDMFDGILAGFPGLRLAYAGAVGQIWDAQAFATAARHIGAIDAQGLPLINKAMSDSDLQLVSKAVLRACDGLDGAIDGMINDFSACTTAKVAPELARVECKGPKTDACLLDVQIAALRKVFDGAKGPDGQPLYSDWPWDAGVSGGPGWRMWKLGGYASAHNDGLAVVLGGASSSAVFMSPPTPVAADPAALTQFVLHTDVAANAKAVRAKWGAFQESGADVMDSDSSDLSRFAGHGGKMIVFHGASDPVFSINDTVRWWRSVDAAEHGRASRFVRLFAVPGMNHGGGGPATDQFDAFAALVAWLEQGRAPDSIIATARATTPWPGRTRPLCPYPELARPIATLTPATLTPATLDQASSFRCAAP